MTASLQIQRTAKGTEYYYIYLYYLDPVSNRHRQKKISTGLQVKGNKRKAQAIIPEVMEIYSYLELSQTPDSDILFCDHLKRWLQKKRAEVKTSTYEGYECRMKKILEYFEPRNLKLREITAGILDEYFHWCLLYGKISQKDGSRSGLTQRSVREYKNLLSAAFDQAIVDGILKVNPVTAVKIGGKKPEDYAEEDMFLTRSEAEDMLRFLDQNEKYRFLMPMAFIMVYFGLRRSELLGLTWNAVDFENDIMHIRQTVVRVKTVVISDLTKTPAGRRDLPLFSLAKECLLQVRAAQEESRQFFGAGYNNEENFIFTWEDGRPYDPDYITKKFKAAMTEFGRPTITPHKLRHTCASFLIEKGWDAKQVQYWMGHKDIQTTLSIYAHYDKHRLRAAQADLCEISADLGDLFQKEDSGSSVPVSL